MTYYADNWEMEEANSGDFTINASGATVYSKAYDVGKFAMSELLIQTSALISNATGGTLTFTLQMYDVVTEQWYDHAASFSTITYADGASQYNSLDIATAFGLRIRMKVASTGTFQASPVETYVVTISAVAKSR